MNDLLEVEEADTPDVSMQVVGDGPWDQQPMAYKAAQAALGEEDAVDITHLASLRPLWSEFDDQVQDDASSFLASLIDVAGTDAIVGTDYHVDYGQEQS